MSMLVAASAIRLQDLPPGLDPERVRPGVLALVVVLSLCVLTFLLWRSMNKQLKKVRFDEEPADERREQEQESLTATRNRDDPGQGPGDASDSGPPPGRG